MVATLITDVPQAQKVGPCFTVKAVTDIRFALLAAGSCLVALGKSSFLVEIIHR